MRQMYPPILVTRDPRLVEVVSASAAALGRSVEVCREPETLRRRWRDTPAALVGADSAEFVLSLGMGAREGVHLVGQDVDELAVWSFPLGASVLALPEQAGALAELLGKQEEKSPTGCMVWVTGSSGGLGASTLSCGLAAAAARTGAAALVELDPLGGLDLICGVEGADGWRWPDLAAAAGQLDDLTGRVPRAGAVDIVAMGRGDSMPGHEAVAAVVGSFRRSHSLVVLDGGRERPQLPGLKVLLLVGADVRSVAAARSRASAIDLADADLVVRTGPGRSISPTLVAESLGLPLLGRVPTDRRLPRMLEAGRLPGSTGGSFRRATTGLVRGLMS